MAVDPPFRAGDPALREGEGATRAELRSEETPEAMPRAPECPFCDGAETEIMNAFGSHASVATYWCRDCRSPFEIMKWRG